MVGLLSFAARGADEVHQAVADHLAAPLARETWKYTPVQGFVDAVLAAPAASSVALAGHDQPGVTAQPLDALDDVASEWLQELVGQQRCPSRYPLRELAWVRASGGWLISIAGTPPQPLTIRYRNGGIAPVVIRLEADARACLVERHEAPDFLAQTTLIALAQGAHLEHHRLALLSSPPHYASLGVRLAAQAGYRLNHNLVGGRRRRAEVHVFMDGRGAEAQLAGAYLVEEGSHLDQQVIIEHRVGDTVSRQKFHGIGAGKGRSVFNGRIHIHPGAARSDAQLSNRNLALHPDAEMNTKPELEIYTDDVRCAHGATVGQLAADSLFYLTSRGISAAEARRLLSHGFVRECLWEPFADEVAARFSGAL
jgi:Fe-S cluster assembly scaffold protein SufB